MPNFESMAAGRFRRRRLSAAACVAAMFWVCQAFALVPRLAGLTASCRQVFPPRQRQGIVACSWSLFGWGEDDKEGTPAVDEKRQNRFLSYAEGSRDDARLRREGLRSLLECTDSFCMTKHWLPESTLDSIYAQYAGQDGIGLAEFQRLAHDGLLLEGKLEEYERAFNSVDPEGTGVISRQSLGQLFAGLGRILSVDELNSIADAADVGHDGIDFADFLGLARTHLDLGEVIDYLETTAKRPAAKATLENFRSDSDLQLETVTTVHSESELDAFVESGEDVVVQVAFTWCRPCKAFTPRYQKFAKVYKKTRFLKIIGNENESCKHYAKEVLKAKISPMFAIYSGGKLVTAWNGANNQRFVNNVEQFLTSAHEFAQARETAVAADASLQPTPPASASHP